MLFRSPQNPKTPFKSNKFDIISIKSGCDFFDEYKDSSSVEVLGNIILKEVSTIIRVAVAFIETVIEADVALLAGGALTLVAAVQTLRHVLLHLMRLLLVICQVLVAFLRET